MKIVAVSTAFPENVFTQQEISGELKRMWKDKLPNPAVLDRLHANCGVKTRHAVLELEQYETLGDFGVSNDYWIKAAVDLGEQAIRDVVAKADMDLSDIGAIFFVSVTGIASPSIDARLVNKLKLSPSIKRIPIFGLGCVAGAAGIARAADYVKAYPDQVALLLSVELCTLNMQSTDISTANLISAGLFGDGAAAVLVAGADTKYPGVEVVDTRSSFYYDTEEVMGWQISGKGFKIVLSPGVPDVVRDHLQQDVDGFLTDHKLAREDVSSWIIHTGGPKVLQAVESALDLTKGELEPSWRSLSTLGNLSSTSILTVLKDFLENRRGAKGDYSVMSAMGPGFCAELLLLRW